MYFKDWPPIVLSAYDHWLVEPVEPLQHQKPHWARGRLGVPITIALDEEEASRFLKALERPDDRAVAKLADLRRA